MKKLPAVFLGIGILLTVIAAWWGLRRAGNAAADPQVLALAQCLKEKNITMYGAYWCPHCLNEKKRFGAAWSEVPYVECTEEVQKCVDAGIKGYPTWIFPDPPSSTASTTAGRGGKRLEGEQGLARLAAESGCPTPEAGN